MTTTHERNDSVTFAVSESEKQRLQNMASQRGITMSDVIRMEVLYDED